MSIFLRGVDMPECCCGCPCCYEKADGSCFCTAVKDGEPCDIEDLDQRLLNCPAEGVPEPHGDLIDRNELLNQYKPNPIEEQLMKSENPIAYLMTDKIVDEVTESINSVKAIIEAEGFKYDKHHKRVCSRSNL